MEIKTLIANYKAIANRKENTSYLFFVYAITRAWAKEVAPEVTLERLKRSFSPVTSSFKLAHGRRPYDTLEGNLHYYGATRYREAYASQVLKLLGMDVTEDEVRAICDYSLAVLETHRQLAKAA